MKCEIASWGEKKVRCEQVPEGNCANCQRAENYINLVVVGSCPGLIDSVHTTKKGSELIIDIRFNDGDPKIYTCRIKKGKYFHFGK